MKLAWAFCFLIILGSSASVAHAQTPVDPEIIIHGSPCVETYCVELVYTGPTKCFGYLPCPNPDPPPLGYLPTGSPFLFALADPITGITNAEIAAGMFTCSAQDLPGIALDDFSGSFNDYTFLGCNYYGLLTGGQGFTWNSNQNTPPAASPDLEVVPEPSSSVLFMSGLILFCLGGFARKRLGSNFRT
jgi:hypothetical protein